MPTYKRLISKVGGLLGLLRVETETGEASYSVDKGTTWLPYGGVRVDDVSYDGETGTLTISYSDGTTQDIEMGVDDFLAGASFNPLTNVLSLTMSDESVIEVDLNDIFNSKMNLVTSPTESTIPTLDASGGLTGTSKYFGGNTFAGTPNVSTIPSESSVKSFVEGKGYLTDAASDTKTYGRKDGAWVEVTGGGGSMAGYPETTDFTDADSGKVATAYVSQGIDAYVKLYLKLDNNVTDSSSSAHTATTTDITYTTDPKRMAFNYGAVFNGTSSKISIPDSIVFGNVWQLDWFGLINNTNSLHYVYSQAKADNTDLALDIYINAGKVGVLYSTNGSAWANIADHVGTTVLAPNVRYFFALKSDGTNISFYINGVLEKQWAETSALHNSAEPLWLGQSHYNDGQYKLAGVLDEFRITVGTTRAITIPSFQYATTGTKSIVLSAPKSFDIASNFGMPNVADGVSKTTETLYFADTAGWLSFNGVTSASTWGYVYSDAGTTIIYASYAFPQSGYVGRGIIPVPAGYYYKAKASTIVFFPSVRG